uniref:Uncharacterized protein n=1 Tax=Pseudocodium devriesii TaxID=453070 RepID=A0A386B130_9CHLO|nr:hypothetical protein [Pseudocodium devriesii]AYC65404.1 hypothetical protein [Pseudocodium devriesii]
MCPTKDTGLGSEPEPNITEPDSQELNIEAEESNIADAELNIEASEAEVNIEDSEAEVDIVTLEPRNEAASLARNDLSTELKNVLEKDMATVQEILHLELPQAPQEPPVPLVEPSEA